MSGKAAHAIRKAVWPTARAVNTVTGTGVASGGGYARLNHIGTGAGQATGGLAVPTGYGVGIAGETFDDAMYGPYPSGKGWGCGKSEVS
jgi:hypothetical protein